MLLSYRPGLHKSPAHSLLQFFVFFGSLYFQKKKARLCMTMATPVLHPEQKLGLVGNSAPTATHKHMKEHGQIGLLYLLV